jgi:P27 family predicted phage terminase small subunit
MGERGPVPKGYTRRRNTKFKSGTHVEIGRPPMPRDLPAEAKAEWRRVVPVLEDIGFLASIDRGVLIRYCTAWGDWCEFARLLERSGKLIKGQKGNLVRNPLWLMKRDAEQTIADLARQLGLTPAARLRAGVTHDRPEDPADVRPPIRSIEDYQKLFEDRR